MLRVEFLSCAFDVTTAQGVQMCDASVVVSDLLFIPEILGDKGPGTSPTLYILGPPHLVVLDLLPAYMYLHVLLVLK